MNNIMICDEIDIMYNNEIRKIISKRSARGETFRCISADMNISISSIHCILNDKYSQKKKKIVSKKKIG